HGRRRAAFGDGQHDVHCRTLTFREPRQRQPAPHRCGQGGVRRGGSLAAWRPRDGHRRRPPPDGGRPGRGGGASRAMNERGVAGGAEPRAGVEILPELTSSPDGAGLSIMTTTQRHSLATLSLCVVLLGAACSDDEPDAGTTGSGGTGADNTGGATTTGGGGAGGTGGAPTCTEDPD